MDVGWWALMVSVVSATFTGLTYWRDRRARPQIRISTQVTHRLDGTQRVQMNARNRAGGSAREVTLAVPGFAKESADVLAYGGSISLDFITRGLDLIDLKYELSWKEEPHLDRLYQQSEEIRPR